MKFSWSSVWHGMWYVLSSLFVVAFFVITYPNGFVVIGWTAFYSLWWFGFGVLIAPLVILVLPYLGRASEWEAERVRVKWLSRLLSRFSQRTETRTKCVAVFLMRNVIALEYFVVNECAKIHHTSAGTRDRMFLDHITNVTTRVLRRNGSLTAEKEVIWRH
ncbi:MAG: hypothetical protein V1885_03160 [Candidatus Brennerbacteria bacterium]